MNEAIERVNANHEFLNGIIAADQALITALKSQREDLRKMVETLINCADINRDITEIRAAHRLLCDTRV